MKKRQITAVFSILLILSVLAILIIKITAKKDDRDYKRPDHNVILISIDTLRADHLGTYGYGLNTSPNIDQFAKRSVVFKKNFSNASYTLPSHMSLMTSLYPVMHGVRDTNQQLRGSIKTLAQSLKENGYSTAAFTAGFLVSKIYGFDRGFDKYVEDYNAEKINPGQAWRLKHVSRNFSFWLEEHHQEKFFAFVHCYDTHEPFIANRYLKKFEGEYSGRLNFLNNHKAFRRNPDYDKYKAMTEGYFFINKFYSDIINQKRIELFNEDIKHIIALYDGEIRFVDFYFGKLLAKLESLGLMDKTIIIFWSDHGEELLERGAIQHGGILYDEIMHVPLIIYIPGYDGPKRNSSLAQSIDIAPTILDILGLEPEKRFHGIPLFSTDHPENHFVVGQQKITDTVRTHKYKLLHYKRTKKVVLFDIKKDPGETTDVKGRHPQIAQSLLKDLISSLDKRKAAKVKKMKLDKKMTEKLRTLGYIK